ncbi:MAG: pseudouridine synthase [Nitrospira sp.]|nr:pseudouridine synthase [Nitrospira sp.]
MGHSGYQVSVKQGMASRSHRTIAFNKPYGALSCFTDQDGRLTLADFISLPGVYPAGRLDRDSEGLMILTSDGALAHRITSPRSKLPKLYLVQVERVPNDSALATLERGLVLSGRRTRPARVQLLMEEPAVPERPVPIRFRKTVPTAWLHISIHEGMNRQVRRMTAAVGHPTLRLIRLAIGPVELGDLKVGHWRILTEHEIRALYRFADQHVAVKEDRA